MHQHKTRFLLIGFMAILVSCFWTIAQTFAQPATSVSLEPSSQTVAFGETFLVTVTVNQAADLGAYQFDLSYDPAILQLTTAVNGSFLGSSGRAVTQLGPIVDNALGKLTLGGFSFGDAAGPDGTGSLADLTFTMVGTGSSDLVLSNLILTSTGADPVPSGIVGAVVNPAEAEPTPTPTTSPTPTSTPAPTLTLTPTPTPSPSPSPNPTATPTTTPTPTLTLTPSPSPTPTPFPTVPPPTAGPTATPSPTPTQTPTPTFSPSPTASPTATPTQTPSPTSSPTGGSATLSLLLPDTAAVNEPVTAFIMFDAGSPVTGVDVFLNFDPEVLSVDSLTDDHLLPITPELKFDNADGAIRLSQLAQPNSPYTGTGSLATISFIPKSVGQTSLTFDFTLGSKADSNAIDAVTGNDILSPPLTFSLTVLDPADLILSLTTPSESTAAGHSVTGALLDGSFTFLTDLTTDNSGTTPPYRLDQSLVGQLKTFYFKVSGFLRKSFDLTAVPGLNQINLGLLRAGDLNDDGIVNSLDLSLLYDNWFNSGAGDFNRDGIVNSADHWHLLQNFLQEDE